MPGEQAGAEPEALAEALVEARRKRASTGLGERHTRAGSYRRFRCVRVLPETFPIADFLFWASRRLAEIVWSAVGFAFAIASMALFFAPSFSPGWSRWWAVAPLGLYVVGALLWADYKGAKGGCLTAQLVAEKDDRFTREWLEIRNCGSVLVRDVTWELLGEPRGWDLLDEGLTPPELERDERLRIPVVTSMGCDPQATVRLHGTVRGREYQRDKLVSVFG
jgi:hypothetical protein